MNHDYTHCYDYRKGKCPKDCFIGQLTKELYERRYELAHLPVSFAHYKETEYCRRKEK